MLQWLNGKHATELLYSASRDGFTAATFHRLCDNKGKTLTVIRSPQNYIFGGFADVSWDSSNTYKNANNWLFTLSNPSNSPMHYYCSGITNAMYCNASYGPTFGAGHDLYVATTMNSGTCNFPSSYSDTTARGSNTFTGSSNFQISEIEVYLIQ